MIRNIIMVSPWREHLALAGNVTEMEDDDEDLEEEEEGGWVMLMLMGRMMLGVENGVVLSLLGELFMLERGKDPVLMFQVSARYNC